MTQHRLSFVPPWQPNGPVKARSYRDHRASMSTEDRRKADLHVKLAPYRNPRRKALVSLPKLAWMERETL